MNDIALCGLIWLLVIYAIQRGYQKVENIERFSILMRSILVLFGLVFTFRTQILSQKIDAHFQQLPVTSWWCGFLLFVAIIFYTDITQQLVKSKPDV